MPRFQGKKKPILLRIRSPKFSITYNNIIYKIFFEISKPRARYQASTGKSYTRFYHLYERGSVKVEALLRFGVPSIFDSKIFSRFQAPDIDIRQADADTIPDYITYMRGARLKLKCCYTFEYQEFSIISKIFSRFQATVLDIRQEKADTIQEYITYMSRDWLKLKRCYCLKFQEFSIISKIFSEISRLRARYQASKSQSYTRFYHLYERGSVKAEALLRFLEVQEFSIISKIFFRDFR